MESVGSQLRTARTRKGLTLEDVSVKTRITVRLLQAIECDDLGQAGSAFLYRSFVRQYGLVVGLNTADLAVALDAATGSIPEPLLPGQPGAGMRPDVPGLKPKRTKKMKWVFSVTSLFIMLGACSTVYEQWQKTRADVQSSPAPSASASQANSPGAPAAVSPNIKANGTEPPPAAIAPPTAGNAADEFSLKLSALENTWLSVAADGQEVFKGTLRADESKTLEGHDTARVRTGNAGGVEVVFNGRSLGRLGREGQTRTVVFTRDSYNILQSRVHIALAAFIRSAE